MSWQQSFEYVLATRAVTNFGTRDKSFLVPRRELPRMARKAILGSPISG